MENPVNTPNETTSDDFGNARMGKGNCKQPPSTRIKIILLLTGKMRSSYTMMCMSALLENYVSMWLNRRFSALTKKNLSIAVKNVVGPSYI